MKQDNYSLVYFFKSVGLWEYGSVANFASVNMLDVYPLFYNTSMMWTIILYS
jgi:hypothetical protein